MTVALAIPETALGWLFSFLFALILALGWYLGAKIIGKLLG